jgi:hypothetical protein
MPDFEDKRVAFPTRLQAQKPDLLLFISQG